MVVEHIPHFICRIKDPKSVEVVVGAARAQIPGQSRWNRGLPKVPFLKNLLIRRQFYRNFSVPKALGPIIDAMPQLEGFRHESWNSPFLSTQVARDIQTKTLLHDILRRKRSLKAFSMHGSTSRAYHFDRSMYDQTTLMPVNRIALIRLGEVLACSTQHLQMIHGARNIEGEGFFRPFWPCDLVDVAPILDTPAQLDPLTIWENLRDLSLTSTRLNPGGIDWLLMAAGSPRGGLRSPRRGMR